MASFDLVAEYVESAKAVAWDGCHKIYVLMDDAQVEQMREYGYEYLVTTEEMPDEDTLQLVQSWFQLSCGLRFIDAVTSAPDEAEDTFTSLIGQFELPEEEEEDD